MLNKFVNFNFFEPEYDDNENEIGSIVIPVSVEFCNDNPDNLILKMRYLDPTYNGISDWRLHNAMIKIPEVLELLNQKPGWHLSNHQSFKIDNINFIYWLNSIM